MMIVAIGRRRATDLVDRLQLAGVLGVLMLVASVPLIDVYRTWAAARAEKAAWDGITGPACPVVDAPSPNLVSRRRMPMEFSYGPATFARQHGHASCAGFRDDGEVYWICQFNAPSVLTVTTPRGVTIFQPGPVRPTTVTIRDGVPACVMGGWFRS